MFSLSTLLKIWAEILIVMSTFLSLYRFQQAPVDKIIFLKGRITNRGLQEGAVLISSEAGRLHFWSIYGFSKNHKGTRTVLELNLNRGKAT